MLSPAQTETHEQQSEPQRAQPRSPARTQRAAAVEDFSADEERWIREVWALPDVKALFGLYPSVPAPILKRVKQITLWDKEDSGSGAGAITRADKQSIDMADNAYLHDDWNTENSREAEFKSVLIHELFHVFQYWSQYQASGALTLRTPARLVDEVGALQFGWFEHPRAASWPEGAQPWCHFQWTAALTTPGDFYLDPIADMTLVTVMKDPSRWERSPDARGPEEDVATCLGMMLGSEQSGDHLADAYPRRYELISSFLAEMRIAAEQAAGIPLG